MINNLNILLPEIFLSLSIFSILLIGVFTKNSYNLVNKLCLVVLLVTIIILINNNQSIEIKIFSGIFIKDPFSSFIKILILISSIFVLVSSQTFIKDNKVTNQ